MSDVDSILLDWDYGDVKDLLRVYDGMDKNTLESLDDFGLVSLLLDGMSADL
jgi:hypothetical protein